MTCKIGCAAVSITMVLPQRVPWPAEAGLTRMT